MNKYNKKRTEEEEKEEFTGTPEEQLPDFEAEEQTDQQEKEENDTDE
ncbi:hypothetical protein [uncultured Planococcus sp.]|nr:hypothetical protein [uncultured Planococcus sp.]